MPGRDPRFDEQARDWQEALARRLADLPYTQLCELPDHREITPPPELAGRRFAVARHGPRNDRLRVEVSEVLPAAYRPTIDAMVRALETQHRVWFEKHSDGHVVWPKAGHEPHE
jgi:hypothetical protein